MLSNKNTYADVRVAVEDAVKAGTDTELTLFGNIYVTADTEIPDYIDVIIAPETKITLADGCKLVAKGDVKDFSGYDYDLSGNGSLVPSTTTTTVSETVLSAATTTTTSAAASTDTDTTTSNTAPSSTTADTTATADTTTAATSTTSAVTSVTTTSAETTTTVDNIASDEELAMWAVNDYMDKNDTEVGDVDVKPASDGMYEITLKDKDNNVLETYIIDPKTGQGTNSANEPVDLPQTGNNSMTDLWLVFGALFMIGLGLAALKLSRRVYRKKDD